MEFFIIFVTQFLLLYSSSSGSVDSCINNSVRLVPDGSSPASGRVEVCQYDTWGTVCHNYYTGLTEGDVICKELGFVGALNIISLSYANRGKGSIWFTIERCEGTESSLFNCTITSNSTCDHYDDLGVRCITSAEAGNCSHGSVRLVNDTISDNSTAVSHSGRVEFCRYGVWGTLCNEYNEFGVDEGDVVCKRLGLPGALTVTYFEQGIGHHWNGELDCKGTERSLSDCRFFYDWTCSLYAGVICASITGACKNGAVRLSYNRANGANDILDICVDGVWGHMSSIGFNGCNGRVACHQLGYSGLAGASAIEDKALHDLYYDHIYDDYDTYLRIWVFQVHCFGNESSLYDCYHIGSPHLFVDYEVIWEFYDGIRTGILAVKCFSSTMLSKSTTVILGPADGNGAVEKSTVNFSCIASISVTDPIQWAWVFDNKLLEFNDRYTITQSHTFNKTLSTLYILNPRKSDEGRYRCLLNYIRDCSIENTGTDQVHYLELEAELAALGSSTEENIKSLSCELTGYIFSDAVIEWYLNDSRIQMTGNNYLISESKGNTSQLINSQGMIVPNIISTLYIYTPDAAGDYQCVVFSNDDLLYVNFTVDNHVTTTAVSDDTTAISVGIVVTGSVGGTIMLMSICVFITITVIILYFKNKKHQTSMRVDITQVLSEDHENGHDYIRMSNLLKTSAQREKLQDNYSLLSCLINPTDLKITEKVGQGEFGVVYRGVYQSNDETLSVAVKTMKGLYSESLVDELFVEADKMKSFDHLHVLSLTGICVGLLESPCIVMPFMSNGSLLSYLRREAADLTITQMADETLFNNVLKHLLSICLQVAKGMDYLSKQKFVHRDLAARNCMISSEGIIKIADFGLAEDIYTTVYFKQAQICANDEFRIKLPLKWMALESIHYGKFTEKTDVWSYGVLCWEVFNGAKTPYPGFTPKEVVTMLDNGERLTKPTNAACTADEVFTVMLSCWEKSPESRPHFFELVERINELLVPLADYMDMSEFKMN